MNEYKWEEIDLSKEYKAEFSVEITEEMMEKFRMISGDDNPLHIDSDYAKAEGYQGRVVYGMLTSSLYSRLAGMYLPGKYCLLQRVDVHFHKPVYIGDKLTVSGYIKKKVEVGQTIVVSAQIENQNGMIISTAKIEAGCLK